MTGMRAPLRIACALGLGMIGLGTGCERLLSIHDPTSDDGGTVDVGDSGGITDAGPAPSSPILLSEVVLTPNAGEMIEIVNTSTQTVDLSTYYLSDSGNYFRLPTQPTMLAVDPTDFVVRFPAGAQILGHHAMTIALDTPSNFVATYGVSPDFSLVDGSLVSIAMNGAANLTNAGEPVILFQWDGKTDLVRDVDIMLIGGATGTNGLQNKSLALQDGPDPGTQPSQYAFDANKIKPQATTPGNGQSAKRILLDDNHEDHNGNGNGPSGDDETSEDTSVTWEISGPATPGTVVGALLR
jgi:hypothetical protein